MNDDRPLLFTTLANIVEAKADGELEVELDGGALIGPLEGVLDRYVDFGPIESSVTRVLLPWGAKRVQALCKLLEKINSTYHHWVNSPISRQKVPFITVK